VVVEGASTGQGLRAVTFNPDVERKFLIHDRRLDHDIKADASSVDGIQHRGARGSSYPSLPRPACPSPGSQLRVDTRPRCSRPSAVCASKLVPVLYHMRRPGVARGRLTVVVELPLRGVPVLFPFERTSRDFSPEQYKAITSPPSFPEIPARRIGNTNDRPVYGSRSLSLRLPSAAFRLTGLGCALRSYVFHRSTLSATMA